MTADRVERPELDDSLARTHGRDHAAVGERITEADGLRAVWRSTRNPLGRIEITAVLDADARPRQVATFAPGTDLAQARELYPKWNQLWDNVKRDYWADIAASAGCPPVTGGENLR